MAKNERFTGGDDLTGIHKKYHDIMMKNELRGGMGAYELSWAGGRSAPSFGGNQMDLGSNIKAPPVFQEIVSNAGYFSDDEIKTLKNIVNIENMKNLVGKIPKVIYHLNSPL